jgi:hypothetical protein
MLKLTGRLVAKSLIKEGENKYGKWQLVNFIIQKQHNKVKKKIIFTAIGKVAKQVQDIQLKERITIYFEPVCNNPYADKWYTELKATEVEKYISRSRTLDSMNGGTIISESEFTFNKDEQLFNGEQG